MRTQSILIAIYVIINSIIITTAYVIGEGKSLFTLNSNSVTQQDNSSFLSYFTKPIFYILKNNKAYLHLTSEELTLNSKTSNIVLFTPSGSIFNKDGSPLRFSSTRGLLKQKLGTLNLSKDVRINFSDTYLTSEYFNYDSSSQKLNAWEDVKTMSLSRDTGDKIYVDSHRLKAFTKREISEYSGNVKGKVVRKRAYEEELFFRTDKLLAEKKKSKMSLFGSVNMKKQGFNASSKRGEVYTKNYNKKLKYYVLYDDVVVVEKVVENNSFGEGRQFERRAFAEKLEGFMSDGKVVLTGYPKVYSEGDVIKGNRITLRKDNDVIEVDDANTKFKLR